MSSNSTVVRKAYGDFTKGDIPSVLAVFDPTIRWHVPGHSLLSGDYQGHEAVLGFFQQTMALCNGVFSIDVHQILAEEDVAVALVTVKAERNGQAAAFPEVHVWRVANSQLIEFREYQGDEQAEDRFWS